MKKIAILFILIMLIIPTITFADSNPSSEQEKQYPTKEELTLVNESLNKMIDEANKKLESGETKIVLEEKIGESNETIELGFEVKDADTYKNKGIQTFASKPSGKKLYFAYVKNTAGWNFEHRLAGEFVYKDGKITGATKDVGMSGAMYSESHNTWIDKLDASVWEVRSHGTFKALKYLMEYNSYLTVRLLGSGDYRIERATINF